MSRISRAFADVTSEGRLMIAPYVALGYPDMTTSIELAMAYIDEGAGMLELGVPFSDPIADGPTIQRATQQALRTGTTLSACIDAAATIRSSAEVPLVLMGYANPFVRRGYEQLTADLQTAGIDGLIVPDLLPEVSHDLGAACEARGLDLVPLIAPTTPDERLSRIAKRARGFVYCVSLTGVTGRRKDLQAGLLPFLQRVRQATPLPRAVGFGVSTPAHVSELCGQSEGVIMASALIDAFETSPPSKRVANAAAIVRSMAAASACQ